MNRAFFASLVAVGVIHLVILYQVKKKWNLNKLIPRIEFTNSGHVKSVETFGKYVVRQLGLDEDSPAARRCAKVAEDYIRGDKSVADNSLDNVFIFLSRVCPENTDDEIENLNQKLVDELDACILCYFSFHWKHSGAVLDQIMHVRSSKKTLRSVVLAATRKHRFQRVMKDLKTKRFFSTMLDQLKAIGTHNPSIPDQGTVVVPAHYTLRSPVLLFIGGGMGAGKSTVVREIMKGAFWSGVANEAVVVEADAFKETDVIYRALSSLGNSDVSEAAQLVHQSSTDAASALLVTALNTGRDVILDGTMSWEPYILQTVAMARDVHQRPYRMGPGYGQTEDGTVYEKYWEPLEQDDAATMNYAKDRKPYRLEFVGVTCDAHLAVMRGMRRSILTKRGVPIKGQLRSHKLFAASLEKYCDLMDHVEIYSTSNMAGSAEIIGVKGTCNKLLKDCDAFQTLVCLRTLNPDADSVLELYSCGHSTALKRWQVVASSPERQRRQEILRREVNNSALPRELSEWDLASLGSSSSGSLNSDLAKVPSRNSDELDSPKTT